MLHFLVESREMRSLTCVSLRKRAYKLSEPLRRRFQRISINLWTRRDNRSSKSCKILTVARKHFTSSTLTKMEGSIEVLGVLHQAASSLLRQGSRPLSQPSIAFGVRGKKVKLRHEIEMYVIVAFLRVQGLDGVEHEVD